MFILTQTQTFEPVSVTTIPPVQPSQISFMHGLNKATVPLSGVTTQAKLADFTAENGFGFWRYRFNLAQYLQNPSAYLQYILDTSRAADTSGTKLIYTNFLDGMAGYMGITPAAFWRAFWDNTSWSGKQLWDHLADFMALIANLVKDKWSTLAYEFCNEPRAGVDSDHEKIKACQEYVCNKIIAIDPDAWIVVPMRHKDYKDVRGFWDSSDILRTFPDITNGRRIYGPHTYFQSWDYTDPVTKVVKTATTQAGFDFVFNRVADVSAAKQAPVILGEWDCESYKTTPPDLAKMQTVINMAKDRGWPLALWAFDVLDASHTCFDVNYDIQLPRNVWPLLLQAMSRTQVGSPK